MSLVKLAWKLKRRTERLTLYLLHKAQARVKPTYSDRDWRGKNKLKLVVLPICQSSYDKAVFWADEVLSHTFDLLGASNVRVHYGLDAGGFDGYNYPPLKADFQFDDKGEWFARFINKTNLPYSRRV